MKINWQEVKSRFWFVFVFILAIELIENQSSNFLAEMAGDIFGAIALLAMGVFKALSED